MTARAAVGEGDAAAVVVDDARALDVKLAAVGLKGRAHAVVVGVEADVVDVDVALVADGEAGARHHRLLPLRLLAGGGEDGDEAVV